MYRDVQSTVTREYVTRAPASPETPRTYAPRVVRISPVHATYPHTLFDAGDKAEDRAYAYRTISSHVPCTNPEFKSLTALFDYSQDLYDKELKGRPLIMEEAARRGFDTNNHY